jgi:hypothetical protein
MHPLSSRPTRQATITIFFDAVFRAKCFLKRLACLVFFALAITSSVSAATGSCTLEGSAPGADLTASVSPPGDVSLFVICSTPAPAPKTVSFVVSDFWNTAGSVSVTLLLPPGFKPVAASSLVGVPFSTIIPFRLHVDTLPTEGTYSGRVVIVAEGSDPVTYKLALTRGKGSAILVLDQQQVTLQLSRSFLGRTPETPVVVTLHEKSGQSGVDGIRVLLEQAPKHPARGFTLGNNVAFRLDQVAVDDLAQWPIANVEKGRSFGPGGQSEVQMRFKNLEAGEYNTVLRFSAANSTLDDAQKLSLTLQVRDSVLWATGLLLFAVSFSFVATKVLTSMWHRFVLLGRIRELRPPWLKNAPAILPVVWVRAVLKEAEDLSRRFWLTGGEQIDARVAQVTALLKVLDEVRRLGEQVQRPGALPALPRVRAIAALSAIIAGLDDETPSDAQFTDVTAKLVAFRGWLDASMLNDCYWTSVRGEIQSLLPKISLPDIPKEEDRKRIAELVSAVTAALTTKPADLAGMMAIERRYAVLKILWRWREWEKWSDFLALITTEPAAGVTSLLKDIDDHVLHEVFQLADDTAWASLQQAVQDQKAKIVAPSSAEGEPSQAYDPLRFDLATGDHRIDHGFLFKHGLKFTWTFELISKGLLERKAAAGKKLTLTPHTTEPRVIQYLPRAGRLTVKVLIERSADEKLEGAMMDAPNGFLPIAPTTDFGIFRGLARVEWTSWILAALVAVVTGLSTFYFKGPTFGTFQDYLTLFLWGAGVDQGKNFLQAMQSYAPQPVKTS